ncbi:alanine--tRNA ligase [Candidatus Parcubacteria bacterium]|nr:MAG: alanine--tRNA ligase [Candidatus Parcubacteria bacterium]
MKAEELRKKYLDFFKSHGHAIIPSASLIPENDPTVLFTTAGMHPLVPFLLGETHPAGKRLANIQKCIRTTDIEEVGDSWHLTFFEMLGNWSLGDYFKKEAIEMSWEFLTGKNWLGIDPEKIYVTVFEGDNDAPRDEESISFWQEQYKKSGMDARLDERIFALPKKDNWWGPAGETGPCGPDTEMFYDTGKIKCLPSCRPGCGCGKYVEIWNDVFMEFNKTKEGRFIPLKQKNVDTGMGLERTSAVLQGYDSVYKTELFNPIIKKIIELAFIRNETYPEQKIRLIADHTRAVVFILGDNKMIVPANIEQGYILRRLIRITLRTLKQIGSPDFVLDKIAKTVIDTYKKNYPELQKNESFILEQLQKEEKIFIRTLEKGLKEFNKMARDKKITGKEAFILFSTYGFPFEMTRDLAKESGIEINPAEFKKEYENHQKMSRLATEVRFKGGLADHTEKTTKLHTATHLLQAALRKVLGNHVCQKGSNITSERLRFDFSHDKKMTAEQINETEILINQAIMRAFAVKFEEMSLDDAKNSGALGLFEHKYGDRVKVYTIYDEKTGEVFSREVCGGPHVNNVKELKNFRIIKEEASSAGIRRIKAVVGKN